MMTVQELSDLFDVLYNNITSNQAPGLNEYEKSVFLTKALEEIIKNYFNPKANPKQEGFDDSPKRQADFATLIRNKEMTNRGTGTFDRRAISFDFPDDIFLCLNEQFTDGDIPLTVVPISYVEYDRVMSKPYKYPPKYQVWRLITKGASNSEVVTSVLETSVTADVLNDLEELCYTFELVSRNPKLVTVYIAAAGVHYEGESVIVTEDEDNLTIDIKVPVSYASMESEGISAFYADAGLGTILAEHNLLLSWPNSDLNYVIAYLSSGVELSVKASTTSTVVSHLTFAEFIGVFKSTNPSYRIRYVKRPLPIILANFGQAENPLSIQGKSTVLDLELPDELYEEILLRAVELAKVAWAGTLEQIAAVNMVTTAGQRSE